MIEIKRMSEEEIKELIAYMLCEMPERKKAIAKKALERVEYFTGHLCLPHCQITFYKYGYLEFSFMGVRTSFSVFVFVDITNGQMLFFNRKLSNHLLEPVYSEYYEMDEWLWALIDGFIKTDNDILTKGVLHV